MFAPTLSLFLIIAIIVAAVVCPQLTYSLEEQATNDDDKKFDKQLQALKVKGKWVSRDAEGRNKSILINGRKFDQVSTIECVDDKFYRLLTKDLELIDPERQIDRYAHYYDYDYAKAVSALIDTPKQPESSEQKSAEMDGQEQSLASHDTNNELLSKDVLDEAEKFWQETIRQYNKTDGQIKASSGSNKSSASFQPLKALANHKYLLSRLESLKTMLLNGEESLIVLNNRVKKLNQAVDESELQAALCNCITSRGGRSALMLMNELFVDKNSYKMLQNLPDAAAKARRAAMDTAEYCSYWYGDTIRSQAVQKEKLIKKLVLKEAKYRLVKNANKPNGLAAKEVIKVVHNNNNTTVTTIDNGTQAATNGTTGSVHDSRQTVMVNLIEMTQMWLPQLAKWINETLNQQEVTNPLPMKQKRSVRRASDEEKSSFSSPFDNPSNYYEFDNPAAFDEALQLRRKRESEQEESAEDGDSRSSSSTMRTYKSYVRRTSSSARKSVGPVTTPEPHPETSEAPTTDKATEATTEQPTTTREPSAAESTTETPKSEPTDADGESRAGQLIVESDFENRVSSRALACATKAFKTLLSMAYDQSALLYGPELLAKDHDYVAQLGDHYLEAFPKHWTEQRNLWSKNLTAKQSKSSGEINRSVDEQIDDSFEPSSSSYERGARLGYTIGRFIGEKAADQWPDPAELNTFTYDSIFLAGVGQGYSEQESLALEKRIVTETAKRVTFTEASRQAFGRALHVAYLNGAFVVPLWGILHAQRAVTKRVAKEGGRIGFQAAARAANEFIPKASKFFQTHRHQRSLSAPYKMGRPKNGKWFGLADQLGQVRQESELSSHITHVAVDCGQRTGLVMGALLGFIVTPEAFETYTRFRGSLEALENEFNQYKLGAMRGYELGETWAQLNYTASLRMNLKQMKEQQAKIDTEPRSGLSAASLNNKTEAELVSREADLDKKASETDIFASAESARYNGPANTNNVFQYMIPNYGRSLLANHSHKHMLTIRALAMDDNLIHDIKYQAGDLIANLKDDPHSSEPTSTAQVNKDDDDMFDMHDKLAGELKGELSVAGSKRPIKFNIIDLGPILELTDSLDNSTGAANNNSNNINKTSASFKELQETPLTSALAKVSKLFMKLSVARNDTSKLKAGNQRGSDNIFKRYLNGNFDSGDGYLSGTFSQLTSHLPNGTTIQGRDAEHPAEIQDDFSLEVAILDELFDRIEKAPSSMESINLVKKVMTVTTMAPRRIESYRDRSASTALPAANNRPKTTEASATTTTTAEPASSTTTDT